MVEACNHMPKWHFVVDPERSQRAREWYEQHRKMRVFARLAGMTVRQANAYFDKKLRPWFKANELEPIKTTKLQPKLRTRTWRPEDEC